MAVAVAVAVAVGAGVDVGMARGVGVGVAAAGVGVGEGVAGRGVGDAVGLGAGDGVITAVLSLPPNEQATLRNAASAAKRLRFIAFCRVGCALHTLVELVHSGVNTAADNPGHGLRGAG